MAVAVLVVATPCPLLLAAPVAMVSGAVAAPSAGVVIVAAAARWEEHGLRPDDGAGQDRHPHRRAPRGDRGRLRARPDGSRGAAAGRLGRPMCHRVLTEAVVTEARTRGLLLSLPEGVEEERARSCRRRRRRAGARGKRDTAPDAAWARAAVSRAGLDGGALVWLRPKAT